MVERVIFIVDMNIKQFNTVQFMKKAIDVKNVQTVTSDDFI